MRALLFCTLLLARTALADGLVDAAQANDQATALQLITQHADVNAAGPDGSTPLLWAAHHGNAPLVHALLQARAGVDARNDYGATPLQEASSRGAPDIVTALLQAKATVDGANADGQTPLMLAVRSGNLASARALLRAGADVNAAEKWRGQTSLMWAAAQSDPAMLRLLLQHRAKPDQRSALNEVQRQVSAEPRALYRPPGGMTALLYAARQGCLQCASELATGGADLNLGDPDNVSPMLMAITNFNFDIAALLLERGADPDQWDWWGRGALYAAVDLNTIPRGGRPDRPSLDRTTSMELIRLLLAAGANPNLQLKLLPPFRNVGADRGMDLMLTIGSTPLLRAAKAGDAPATRLLLEHGARTDLPNENGVTPIMAAAGMGSINIDARGRYASEGETPLMQQEAIATLKLLLAHGADVNSRDLRGQTPLHSAALWGWNAVVRFLVANGARLDVKDNKGMTPIDSAMGRAGGNGRGGATVIVRKETAALIEQLAANAAH